MFMDGTVRAYLVLVHQGDQLSFGEVGRRCCLGLVDRKLGDEFDGQVWEFALRPLVKWVDLQVVMVGHFQMRCVEILLSY